MVHCQTKITKLHQCAGMDPFHCSDPFPLDQSLVRILFISSDGDLAAGGLTGSGAKTFFEASNIKQIIAMFAIIIFKIGWYIHTFFTCYLMQDI